MVAISPVMSVIGLLLLIFGGLLLRRGYWGRRTGQTPHCRGCGYILNGLPAGRCPECGADVSARSAVVLGERQRRPSLAWIGVACLLLGGYITGCFITDPLSRAAWNKYKPLGWLVWESDTANPLVNRAAWAEIQRRLGDGSLSTAQIDSIVEHALSLQKGRPYASPNEMAYFDFLTVRAEQHKLSDEQERRFIGGALRAGLTVRALVGCRDRVPIRVFGNGRGPSRGWWNRASATVQVDGGPEIEVRGTGVPESGQFDGWAFNDDLPPQSPGKHHVRVTVMLSSVVFRAGLPPPIGPRDRVVTRVLEADFQSIDGEPPIATNTLPPMATYTSGGTVPGPTMYTARLGVKPGPSLWLHLHSMLVPPTDAAFDCLVRIGKTDYPFGAVTFHSGKIEEYEITTGEMPWPLPPTVDLVLRGSADAARQTPDLTSTWVGEIVLRNVPVRGLKLGPSRGGAH